MFLLHRFLASVDKSCTKKAEALLDTTLCCDSAEVLTVAGISVLVIRIKVSVHVILIKVKASSQFVSARIINYFLFEMFRCLFFRGEGRGGEVYMINF